MEDDIKDIKSNLYQLKDTFPPLYGIEKNGKVKLWSAYVYKDKNSDKAICLIEFGQLDGKKQTVTRRYTEGKNIGKKNETTAYTQCLNETKKKWTDKKDKENYKEELEENDENRENNENKEKDKKFFPMLAHTYEPESKKNKKNDIKFPCFVQPKLDGLRCIMYLSDSEIKCQSRTGTYFESLSHITEELKDFFKNNSNIVFDGELYTDSIPFEELAGLIKKKKISPNDIERLKNVKYHIYDIIEERLPYTNRLEFINNNINNFNYVTRVKTDFAEDKSNFKKYFGIYIQLGYEGIMLRNVEGLYKCNYRSHDLQKYKEFLESEYVIGGFKEGEGRDKGTVIWICKTDDNKEFSVRPKGSIEYRKACFDNGGKYIGKKLTVIYQELSELGIPRFPVGKAIRDVY